MIIKKKNIKNRKYGNSGNSKTREKLKIDFKYNLGVYFGILKKYKWMVFFLIFISILIQARIVLDRFLFKIVIDRGAEFSSGLINYAEIVPIFINIGIVFIIAFILFAIFRFLNIHFINKLETNMMFDLKRKYFNHLVNLDHKFHITHKTGSMISRISRGSNATERITDVIVFNFGPLILELIIALIFILYFDLISALLILSVSIIFISFNFLMLRAQQSSNLEANKNEDIEKGNVADFFTNIDSIKYYGKEEIIKKKFKELSGVTRDSFRKNWNYFRWSAFGQALILGVGAFFVVFFSIKKFLEGDLSLGTLAFIYTIYLSLIGNMHSFVHGIRGFYRSMADFQELFYYGKINKDILDKPDSKDLKIVDGEIEFKNVSFSYGKRKIFDKFNLKIPKNKKFALVGYSGSGKTTFVKLLYRLFDVEKGSGGILIDGKDIREFKQESVRSEMAIVPQEAVLFDDTIYNNICFSNPSASRSEVMAAIKFAQLDRIINEFYLKENTIVGERGIKLSGGEKQRVSIARAILANKRVLVLDEATSSLDSQTEGEIQEDLKKLMKGRTTIIIAHRLSTIINADTIVVFEKGKIAQMGSHSELIKKSGIYKKLWDLQKGGYIK